MVLFETPIKTEWYELEEGITPLPKWRELATHVNRVSYHHLLSLPLLLPLFLLSSLPPSFVYTHYF
jgi:hypothetical protein